MSEEHDQPRSGHAEECIDHAHNYELLERAMTLWVWGELSLRHLPWMYGDHLSEYEHAIAAGVEFLRQFRSMHELFAAYYRGEGYGDDDWEVGNWVGRICDEVGADPSVSRSIVEDASYFRRSRELIQAELQEG